MRITAYNRGPDPATLHIVPQLWFPNTWSWPTEKPPMPSLTGSVRGSEDIRCVTVRHPTLGKTYLYCLPSPPPVGPTNDFEVDPEIDVVQPNLLFTENNTNFSRLYGGTNETLYVKDAFHDHIIPSHRPPSSESQPEGFFSPRIRSRTASSFGDEKPDVPEEGPCTPFPATPSFVNPEQKGTKSAAHYVFSDVPGHGGCAVVRLKLTPSRLGKDISLEDEVAFDDAVEERRQEADEFYNSLVFGPITDDLKQIMRQAFGGMLWTKQYYRFIQKEWLEGDPAQPPPPPNRKFIRNRVRLLHKFLTFPSLSDMFVGNRSGNICILKISCPCLTSMSTFLATLTRIYSLSLFLRFRWEYPFFAAWDTAFHCIPLAVVDPAFAKKQLDLLTREWYMKPDGQIPAYEWNFSDVNPPVHAWSVYFCECMRFY